MQFQRQLQLEQERLVEIRTQRLIVFLFESVMICLPRSSFFTEVVSMFVLIFYDNRYWADFYNFCLIGYYAVFVRSGFFFKS